MTEDTTTAAIRARLDEPLHGYASRWPSEIYVLRGALNAVLDLCDQWDSTPGSGHGLQMHQMTSECAAYWVRERIADALREGTP